MIGQKCSYREWDLTDIPCNHACACVNYMREDPVKYIDKCYYKATYIETYKYALKPLNGLNMWSAVEGWPIHPPLIKKNPGRPKKLRKKDLSESSSGKGPRFS